MEILKKFRVEIAILTCGLIAIHLVAFWSDAFRETSEIGQQSAGLFGDFVGGYFGTIFALFGTVLLYATLKSQIQSVQRLSFESKFYEMLRLHRDNVTEIRVGDASGRSFFVEAWKEYREALKSLGEDQPPEIGKKQLDQIITAYYCVFLGTGNSGNPRMPSDLHQVSREHGFAVIPYLLANPDNKQHTKNRIGLSYLPFEGHHALLGHYYRHLYQTIKYIDTRSFLSETEKYDYAKTLRAQLSNYEQALLLVNSLTPLGQNWIRNGYLKKYKFVKNIPVDVFTVINEYQFAELGAGYFEWEERQTEQA